MSKPLFVAWWVDDGNELQLVYYDPFEPRLRVVDGDKSA